VPTKKQQRRRQKQQRHEYEEVYVDETGRELAADEAQELVGAAPPKKASAKAARQRPQRGGRTIEPPSWRKVGRRGLLFFPLMLITVMLLSKNLSLVQQVFQTILLMAFFLPFSYFMDTMMWRSYQRRLARQGEKKA
jgi:cytochrome c-type biogenesis protein CcmH/NrfG